MTDMKTVVTVNELQTTLSPLRRSGQRIALVPTMGNLHRGHLALVDRARQQADVVVVSIFVNPMQFGANEDLDKYPRTLAEDQQKLQAAGTDLLFTPPVDEMYPNGLASQTRVQVPGLTERFCGASRPGHFDGVSTVVCKLFNMVQPDVAVFGEKDFQQLAVIRKMVADLCMPIQIIGQATWRADDGLALSSRNQYLSATERNIAPLLFRTLESCRTAILAQQKPLSDIHREAVVTLEKAGFRIDYLAFCDALTLADISAETREIAVLAAVFLGQTRLIDNLHFSLNTLSI